MLVKKVLVLIFMLAFGGVVYGQFTGDGSKATIVGTKHDLRGSFEGSSHVCEFCHAPHKLVSLSTEPPLLWNVQVKQGPYSLYSSSSFDGAGTIRDPSTANSTTSAAYMSLLCMSCHDGAITRASFYTMYSMEGGGGGHTHGPVTAGEGEGELMPPNIGIGGLANDHPVDFVYSVALATSDGGLKPPTEGAGIRVPYVGPASLPLYKDQPGDISGRLECATCHNPHNNANGMFLRVNNTGSNLCLSCHST